MPAFEAIEKYGFWVRRDLPEQKRRKGRRHSHRHSEGGHRRQQEGKREWGKERTLKSCQKKHRQHRQRQHEGGVNDRAAHFDRGRLDDPIPRLILCGRSDTPHDIFDIDDGIVDHDTERHR